MSARWLPPWLLLAVGAAMLAWTWGKWPDVLVDFGRELYVAWQISDGKVLYRDIACVQGPLSPHVNAVWFALFGASVRTLMFANLAILGATTILLYRLLLAISSRFAATMASAVFLALFGFVQYGAIGNYNYVCPYRHEVTHGMALALAALNCLTAWLERPKRWLLAGAGACTGLVALTKGEFFVALVLALVSAFGLIAWLKRPDFGRSWRELTLFLAAGLLPILVSLGLLAFAMPLNEALLGVLGSWPATMHDAFRSSPFVQHGLGTADVPAGLKAIGQWTLRYALVFGTAAGVGLALRTRGWIRPAATAGLIVLLLVKLRATSIHWTEALRPLPLLLLLFAAVAFVRVIRRRNDPVVAHRLVICAALIVFAGVLLGKMALNTRLHHYGFALAMPGTMVLVITLTGWIPSWIERRGGFGWALRGVALVLIALLTQWYLSAAEVRLRFKSVPVGGGADTFLADARGVAVNEILLRLREQTKPGETLLVLPEGAMLNFLSRRAGPVPYVDFVPTEYFYFGEDRILAAVQARPPDYIALVHNDTSEFGFRFFGQDYGQRLFAWIQGRYHEVALAGARPFTGDDFGILLLRRTE